MSPAVRPLFTGVMALLLSATTSQSEDKPAPAGPLSPQDSLKQIQLHPACRIELVAAEPQVIDPVAVRFDEDGRLWVVEMRDYPHGPAKGEKPKSQIRILEDRDGDGRYETSRVFADKLLFVTGVQPWKGGVFVTLAGRVAYMKDTDGDGRADVDETWYTGFAQENSQLRANHPRFALDNHIYIANGLRGGKVVNARKKDDKPINISGMDFRFDPLTGECEAVSGVGQFGLTFDDYGNRFVCSNRNPLKHIVLEQRYLKRNPNVAVPAVAHDVAAAGEASRIYPISRAWTTSNLHAGQFTAACGVNIYRGDALPKEFYGNGFTCDPTGNLVHREIIKPLGATFTSAPGRKGIEFLASRDEWFRPVNLETGPDGALYLVDMYRAVIEHPQFMPTELKTRPDLLLGNDRGRIWRIVAKDGKPKKERPQLSKAKGKELVELLKHPNAWWRETAQRLLVQRQDKTAVNRMDDQARKSKQPLERIHALWTLQGLGSLRPETNELASLNISVRVFEQTLVLAEPRLARLKRLADVDEKLRLSLFSAVTWETDARLRFQGFLSRVMLPKVPADKSDAAAILFFELGEPAVRAAGDVWSRRATAIAAGDNAEALLVAILGHLRERKIRKLSEAELALIGKIAELSAPAKDAWKQWLHVFEEAKTRAALGDAGQRAVLLGFARALSRKRSSLNKALEPLDDKYKKRLRVILDRSTTVAADPKASGSDRGEAIALLAEFPDYTPFLIQLALENRSQSIRQAAIAALSRQPSEELWPQLLKRFPMETPAVRGTVLNAVLARSQRVKLLLDAIAANRIKPAELDRTTVNRLLRHGDAAIQKRVRKLLAGAIPADRKKVLANYQVVLKMKGDARRGLAVFKKNCANCHRVGEIGVNVAPDISDSRTKQPAQLLTDILQPNRAIDANYVSYTIQTAAGQSLNGIIASESATSVTLKQPEGKTVTLLRSEIDQMQSGGISLMPEGLEKNIPPQAMADLISYIKNWRYLDGRTPLGK